MKKWEKFKAKVSGSQPAAQAASQPTPQPQSTPSPPVSILSKLSPSSLQEQLWNRAYDNLKQGEHKKVVNAYEEILSAELCLQNSTPVAAIGQTQETRHQQMKQLVEAGLGRTQKSTAFKAGVEKGVQAVQQIKGVVDNAVQASPQAAIAWVGVCIGLEVLSNTVTEASINRQGLAHVLSRMEWYWHLVDLLLDENKAEKSSAGLRNQLENHIVELYQKLLLYQMKSACLYRKSTLAVIGRDAIKLNDWSGQLQEIQLAEEAVLADAQQYNSESSNSRLRKLVELAAALQTNLYDIHSAIQDQTEQQKRIHQDDKDSECLRNLRITDPRKDKERIENTKGGLLKDSYSWVLNHADFRRFRDDPQNRLLWIKGDPGKGKTMLLCGIIDEIAPTTLLSYFFCQATEAALDNAISVLRGLIYLLLYQQPQFIVHLRTKYDVAGVQLFQDLNAWESLVEIFINILNDPALGDIILIVDALDECTDRHRLLKFITQTSSTVTSRVKWIISSRNWQDIEEMLANAKQKVRLHLELNKDTVSEAVNIYIKYKVNELAQIKHCDEQTKQVVLNELTSKANGTFLWVALVCQELLNPKTRKRQILSKLKSFPTGLNDLYARMMKYISDDPDSADYYKEVLAIASVVYRPISLAELKVLAKSLQKFDQGELEEIIGSCGSFLTLQKDVVYFVHQSAKDYLLKQASSEIFSPGISQQHHVIFSRSLEALFKNLKHDIYDLKTPGVPISEVVPPPGSDPLAPIQYSCIYWADHLNDSNLASIHKDLQDNGVISNFIQQKYLYWLESLSLLGRMVEGTSAVLKLEDIVRSTKSQQLKDLLDDARRFIFYHKFVIENWPLQTYMSALLFSPRHSLIRGLFKNKEPKEITVKPVLQEEWSACLKTPEGHNEQVNSAAFSSDSSKGVSASGDKTIKIWDTNSGTCLKTLEGHNDWVNSAAFSSDSSKVVSASDDYTIKIWDTNSGKCLQTLDIGILCLKVSFDTTGSYLLTDFGAIALRLSASSDEISNVTDAQFWGPGLSPDGIWITRNSEKILWIPWEYRPQCSAVSGKTIWVATGTGRVWICRVEIDDP